jgi:hypothetical protein
MTATYEREKGEMETAIRESRAEGVVTRVLRLYGAQAILTSGAYLFGFYLLPEGIMRATPSATIVDATFTGADSFWSHMGLTVLWNLVMMGGFIVVANMIARVNGLSLGCLIPIALGVSMGLVSGTNSFLASDMTGYNVWEGQALALSIGGVEALAMVLVAAATANLAMAQYRSWWRSSGEWKPTRRHFRELRLTRSEIVTLAIAVLLYLAAAYRETSMLFEAW